MLRRFFWIGLAIVVTSSGCTHNYYYGTNGGCPPFGQAVTSQVGQICEVPNGTVVTSNSATPSVGQAGTSAAIVSSPQPQRIVVGQSFTNSSYLSRNRWHRTDPESVATFTRVDGNLPESTSK